MCFVSIYEDRTGNLLKLFQEGEGSRGRMTEGVNLRYIVSTYVNITIFPLLNYYMLIKF
jgi:hypothetical protein